jgi:N-acetylglucosamine-6-phosphate deacetylase
MEGTEEAVKTISRHLARHGTTAYLATTVSASPIATIKAVENLGRLVKRDTEGAQLVGLHLEGPFLSEAKRGAHLPELLRRPSIRIFDELVKMSQETIRLVTLAPELEGALEFIRNARTKNVVVSLGHSNATFEEAIKGMDAGATMAAHTFNAMRDFNHREPGILGAVLSDPRVQTEVIADGVHVHPAAVRILLKCKGVQGVLLVTDAISAGGMPDGSYRIGDIPVTVSAGVCRNAAGQLAGSTLTQDQALRNVVQWTGLPLEEAILMCAGNAARVIGLDEQKGTIEPGKDADMIFLDTRLEVQAVLSRGRWVHGTSPLRESER